MPRFTGFGANITLTGLHNSNSWPGLTDRHSDISIWLASVHTLCDNSKLVRRRQLFAKWDKEMVFIRMRVYTFVDQGEYFVVCLLSSSFSVMILFKSRIRGTTKCTFWSGYLILKRKSRRCFSRRLSISAKNGMAAMRPAVTLMVLSLEVADVGSSMRAVQIFIWKKNKFRQ